MQGFDPEFKDLDQYIRVITDRIWEGRRIDDIGRYYGEDCAIETPTGVSIGIMPVIDGTRATLAAFPDRRLLAEDVIISGDAQGGFLSSHRIASPMTHAGAGAFGAPTGRAVFARTIADCVCINNRIVHEWLVRDQAAIARQIGRHERDLAQQWLDERGARTAPPMPPPPLPYVPFIDPHPLAQAYAASLRQAWGLEAGAGSARTHADGVISALPGARTAVGLAALQGFWNDMSGALQASTLAIEHMAINARAGRATALTLRWRVQARHLGDGRYDRATGHPVQVLGISHADIEAGQVQREWHLIDDVAIWMQLLSPSA